MTRIHLVRMAGLVGLIVAALIATTTKPAAARTYVSVGVGVGFPVYYGSGYAYGSNYRHGYNHGYHHRRHHYRPHYRPHYRSHYRPYYPPPAVIYAPPPVVYAPPPAVIYRSPVQATPTSEIYRARNGQYCREFQSTATINGGVQDTYGTACQDAGGTWRVVN